MPIKIDVGEILGERGDEPETETESAPEPLEVAADELRQALEEGNAKGIADALRAAVELIQFEGE